MKLVTAIRENATTAARVEGDSLVALPYADVPALLASGPSWAARAAAHESDVWPLDDAVLAPPTPRPEKIFCIGLNYRDHAEEAGLDIPKHPPAFAKFWRALIGATSDIILPENSDKVDWEVELGVIIGRPVRHATESEALDAIAGYTIVNDISMRDWQRRTTQFLQGKTFESATPVGPYLVTPDEVDHARQLRLTCSVDGVLMQDGSTDEQIFSPVELVQYLSQIITLMPGDLIATGTPAGVGAARRPPVFLESGMVVSCAIEGLGKQTNRCVAAAPVAAPAGQAR